MKNKFSPRVLNSLSRSLALLFVLFIMTVCAGLPCQAGQAPSIKALTPDAVDPLGLPVKLTLTGSGFTRGTIIRLSHPSNPNSVVKVSPGSYRS